jgi:branched-chain amino acid transport system substrate-binding protein
MKTTPMTSLRRSALATMAGIALAGTSQFTAAATIGLMAPLSGPQAIVGQDQVDGFMLAVEQLGGKLGGQPANVLKEDDQLKPEIGSQIVRKFIDKDKVDAIVGLSFSNVTARPKPWASLPRTRV